MSACNVGDLGWIPGLGRSLGGGNGKPDKYSCLENAMDEGAWLAIVNGIAKIYTLLSNFMSLSELTWEAVFLLQADLRLFQASNEGQLFCIILANTT